MDGSTIALIMSIPLLVACSGFFSASETAFSSFNRVRMKNRAGGGDKKAKRALQMSENYDKLLSTILVGNNIVNIASASLATILFTRMLGNAGVSISTIVMTVVVLIFGEISPKSMAKENAEAFARNMAGVLYALQVVLTPVNYLFSLWKKVLSRVFRPKHQPGLSEEELITLVDEAQSDGGIDEKEGELIRSAIEFSEVEAGDILTPRTELVGVELQTPLAEVDAFFQTIGYSRLPVYEETIDAIIGVVHEKDVHARAARGESSLSGILQPVTVAMENTNVFHLLRTLQKAKTHMAVVVDEFGGTVGIVTMEDILEELVGEIWDEHDEVTQDFIKEEGDSYLVDCSANLEKMLELFGVYKEYDCTTVSGWVMRALGKIPALGDTFECDGLKARVTKVDARRAEQIRVGFAPEREKTGE